MCSGGHSRGIGAFAEFCRWGSQEAAAQKITDLHKERKNFL
jgi:hypothetical protein